MPRSAFLFSCCKIRVQPAHEKRSFITKAALFLSILLAYSDFLSLRYFSIQFTVFYARDFGKLIDFLFEIFPIQKTVKVCLIDLVPDFVAKFRYVGFADMAKHSSCIFPLYK